MPYQLLLASTVFLSAFLLFLIQPLISRYILPWFGGTPATWSAAMLFFQTLLMAGYAYAHSLWQKPTSHPKRRILLHACLVGGALLLVTSAAVVWGQPLLPGADWKPPDASLPILRVLIVLLVSVGLPYFVLSTSSPLLQKWSQLLAAQRSPYRLYALSNLGSFLALACYPFLMEPFFTLQQQAWIWSGGFLIFVGLCAWLLVVVNQHSTQPGKSSQQDEHNEVSVPDVPSRRQKLTWFILPAVSSILLLAVTNALTQDIAVIPFLWVLPLGIYLLSFSITFVDKSLYRPVPVIILLGISLLLLGYSFENILSIGIATQIILVSFFLLIATIFLHGELYKTRPHSQSLTSFYLWVSAGSVAGALFVNLVAPLLFSGYWELQLGMLACWVLVLILVIANRKSSHYLGENQIVIYAWLFVMGLISIFAFEAFTASRAGALESRRNFYGVMRIRSVTFGEDEVESNMLSHGATTHGYQFTDPSLSSVPTAYFGLDSGIGLAFTHLAKPDTESGRKIGIVGLGIGTLAAYGQPGDHFLYYEINPQIIEFASGKGGYFTYLQDTAAKNTIKEGDGRLLLEGSLEETGSERFDMLVLDAFSSDSIPVHLLTTEAFSLYMQHLKPDGVLAVNVSNRYLDITPLIQKLGEINGLHMVKVTSEEHSPYTYPAVWMLLSSDQSLFNLPAIDSAASPLPVTADHVREWTDSYSNLLPYLRPGSAFRIK